MSVKKRKKINPKRLKQIKAEQKNYFFKRIRYICSVIGGNDIYHLLSKEELEKLYRQKVDSIRVRPAPGYIIPDRILKYLRYSINHCLQHKKIPLVKDGPALMLSEFCTTVFTFYNYLCSLEEKKYRSAGKIKEIALAAKCKDSLNEALKSLHISMKTSGVIVSTLDTQIYWYKHTFHLNKSGQTARIENLLLVYAHKPESIRVVIDGIARPAFRVCWAFSEGNVIYSTIKYSSLYLFINNSAGTLPVYIQSHAIHRLRERLDVLDMSVMDLFLFRTFDSPNVICRKDNTYLVEYNVMGIKTGYLLGEVIDDAFIIRTFLFITQNGTPEAQKLSELYGLCKLDISYLAMDKLSSFMTPDIQNNADIRNLLCEAGCGSLLDAYNFLKIYCDLNGDASKIAELINYIGFNKDEMYSPAVNWK